MNGMCENCDCEYSSLSVIRRGDIAILIFQDGGRTAIVDVAKPEIAPSDPPTLKTHRRTKHEVDWTTPRGDHIYGHLKFSQI